MRFLRKTTTLLCCALIALQSFANIHSDEPITFEDLPLAAQHFILTQFTHFTVTRASYNTQVEHRDYEVHLSDNTTLTFDEIGNWSSIEREDTAVPATLIPEEILHFINDKFCGAFIFQIEKNPMTMKIVLDNHQELSFDSNFNILDFDEEEDDSNIFEE